jgi:ribosomal-protein-alanine N-acetyltransferase
LRVGLATIQGFALPLGRTVIGVPTLEAMASGWIGLNSQEVHGERGTSGAALAVCLDGARGDVFCALYDVTSADTLEGARVLLEPFAAAPLEAAARLAAAAGGRRIFLTGNPTAAQHTQLLESLRVPDLSPMPNLAAAAVALARRRPADAVHPHALRPVYVRKPDAVLARERQTEISVALATSSDALAEAAALQARAFEDAWGAEALGGGSVSPGVARVYIARLGGNHGTTGSVVAYCACWRIVDELHINSVAVEPGLRRRGIARSLLRRVLEIEAASGARAATLEVRESNRAGRALYEALGFRVEGVRRDYYQNPREDALVLWKRQ